MYREKTKAEIEKEKNPTVDPYIAPKPQQMTADQAQEVLQGTVWGSCCDTVASCFKGVEYAIFVVCCCGTSFEEYCDD